MQMLVSSVYPSIRVARAPPSVAGVAVHEVVGSAGTVQEEVVPPPTHRDDEPAMPDLDGRDLMDLGGKATTFAQAPRLAAIAGEDGGGDHDASPYIPLEYT
jgi:hypothetical protein